MRKIKILFIVLMIFIGIRSVNALDNTTKVYDYAQVLSVEEENSLKQSVNNYISNYNMDMVLVTVKYHTKTSTKIYSEDFYDYNNFGVGNTKDGIIFVIDFNFGYTDIYISTTGEAIRMYDDYRIDNMLDDIASQKNNGYYSMFNSFINNAGRYASYGIPDSNNNTYINSNGDYIVKTSIFAKIIIPFIIAIIVSSIVLGILIYKNRMIRKSINAKYYLKEGSLQYNTHIDKFLTTHTTSVRINTSSSSSGRSGGSSVSRGSSGRSHGGGGRRL